MNQRSSRSHTIVKLMVESRARKGEHSRERERPRKHALPPHGALLAALDDACLLMLRKLVNEFSAEGR